jgi:hypothetical protein
MYAFCAKKKGGSSAPLRTNGEAMKLWKNKEFVVVDEGSDAAAHFLKNGYKENEKLASQERADDPFRQEGDIIDIDAMNKVQIEDMARQEFGVELDRRWALPRMQKALSDLFTRNEEKD